MYYTCEQHKKTYNDLVKKYNASRNNEYKALLYLLTASDNTRRRLADCIENFGTSILVKEDALHHGWVTGGDARLIRLAFNLYTNGVPTAMGLDGEDHEYELTACTPVRVFSGLDDSNFKAAITGLQLWANNI